MIGGAILQLAAIFIGYASVNPVLESKKYPSGYTYPSGFSSLGSYELFWCGITVVEIAIYAYFSMCLFAYSTIRIARKKRRVIREGKY